MGWLMLAIGAEVAGTAALATLKSRRRPGIVATAAALWALSLYLFSLAVRTVPLGAAYAIWSGLGTAVLALIGWWALRQRLQPRALMGMVLIVAGVVVLQLLSGPHNGVSG